MLVILRKDYLFLPAAKRSGWGWGSGWGGTVLNYRRTSGPIDLKAYQDV